MINAGIYITKGTYELVVGLLGEKATCEQCCFQEVLEVFEESHTRTHKKKVSQGIEKSKNIFKKN